MNNSNVLEMKKFRKVRRPKLAFAKVNQKSLNLSFPTEEVQSKLNELLESKLEAGFEYDSD